MFKSCLCLASVFLLVGCDQVERQTSRVDPQIESTSPVIITDSKDLKKYVGQIVTLKGRQSNTKATFVLGVRVYGMYSLNDEMVGVTGRLSKFEVGERSPNYIDYTADDDNWLAMSDLDMPFRAGPILSAGTHYSISDVEMIGQMAKSWRWNSEKEHQP